MSFRSLQRRCLCSAAGKIKCLGSQVACLTIGGQAEGERFGTRRALNGPAPVRDVIVGVEFADGGKNTVAGSRASHNFRSYPSHAVVITSRSGGQNAHPKPCRENWGQYFVCTVVRRAGYLN